MGYGVLSFDAEIDNKQKTIKPSNSNQCDMLLERSILKQSQFMPPAFNCLQSLLMRIPVDNHLAKDITDLENE